MKSSGDLKALEALRWEGPVLGASGFGQVGRNLVARLLRNGAVVEVSPVLDCPTHRGAPIPGQKGRTVRYRGEQGEELHIASPGVPWMLDSLLPAVGRAGLALTRVAHTTPPGLPTVNPSKGRWAREVGYVAFEMDRLPPSWLSACMTTDELWVPSTFCHRILAESGIEPAAIHVVPHGVDTELFDPSKVVPLDAISREFFTFLSIFQWEYRKGWDVLLDAYLQTFARGDDTQLVILTAPRVGEPKFGSRLAIHEAVAKAVRKHGGPLHAPRIELLETVLTDEEMPSLYAAADAFVLPSRGEGFGLPLLEAMAMALPTLGTAWGGPLDFLDQTVGFPIPIMGERIAPEGLVAPYGLSLGGARMGEPDVDVLCDLMRFVYENRDVARRKGLDARDRVRKDWSWERSVEIATSCLREVTRSPIRNAVNQVRGSKGTATGTTRVAWEGTFLARHSLSLVNRELVSELARLPSFDLSIVPFESRSLPDSEVEPFLDLTKRTTHLPPADAHVYVRHQWPPFLHRPASGRWVLMQPWEFGSIPRTWLPALRNDVDQVWVPSGIVREMFVESGVSDSKVKVVPHGVRQDLFHPGARRLGLPTNRQFRFLYVGGSLPRKGLDILVRAYADAFSATDDVSLVIKESRAGGLYGDRLLDPLVDSLRRNPGCPEILRLDAELTDKDLAGLFCACDAYVQPYRGEGFGLPILEAMAAGLPVVVTAGGASDDFVRDDIGYRIPSRRTALPGFLRSELDLCGGGWWLEPDYDSLVDLLRHVFEKRDEASSKGRTASEHVRRGWTWKGAAGVATREILGLADEVAQSAPRSGPEEIETASALSIPGLVPYVVDGMEFQTRIGTMDEGILQEVIVNDFYGFRNWRPRRAEDALSIVDIGAHVGGFSRWAAKLHPSARIVAFECFPENAVLAKLNTGAVGNVLAVEAAVVGRSKPRGMVGPVFPNTGGGCLQFGDGPGCGISCCTLSEILSTYDIDRVDYLKLDCEGSEWPILEDAPAEVLNRIDCLSMELHCDPGAGRSVHRMGLFLKRYFREVRSRASSNSLLWQMSASDPIF